MKMLRLNSFSLALLAGLLLMSPACSPSGGAPLETLPEAAPPALPSVQTSPATTVAVNRTVEVVGTVLPDEEVTLSNEVGGKVIRIDADFGDPVAKGQPLVFLDPKNYELAVERAEAALAQALATLGLPPDGDETALSVDDDPAVQQAHSALEDARTKLESAAKLFETRDIPEQRYLELQKMVEQREAAIKGTVDQVRVKVANVKMQRALLELERERLQDTVIRAPFSGSVAARMVGMGQFLRDNTALLTIVKTNPLRLRAQVPETGTGLVKVGVQLSFQTDAYPDRQFEALVTKVSPVLDSNARTLSAEARVKNDDGALRPGMFVKITAVLESDSPAVMVPRTAVASLGGLNKVFVLGAEDRLEERIVELGQENGDLVEISNGVVREGDVVVSGGLNRLRQGLQVQVVNN